MDEEMSTENPDGEAEGSGATERFILDPDERRVIGTLIEKGLTNPTTYPLTTSALASGCNQKSNRDPITRYGEEELQGICQRLMDRQLVTRFRPGETGRVERFRQEMGRNFEFRGVELAVIAELLLRGPQAVGELRQRASRMREVASLEDLREILDKLAQHEPPFVTRLSPEGAVRGVRYTHAAYSDEDLAAVLAAEATGAPVGGGAPRVSSAPRSSEIEELKARVTGLEDRLARLEAALGTDGADPA